MAGAMDQSDGGGHNALNAAAAVILAHQLGAEWEDAAEAMATFQGLDRRMQLVGAVATDDGEVDVYDDYAHHPTEIEQTLRAPVPRNNPIVWSASSSHISTAVLDSCWIRSPRASPRG